LTHFRSARSIQSVRAILSILSIQSIQSMQSIRLIHSIRSISRNRSMQPFRAMRSMRIAAMIVFALVLGGCGRKAAAPAGPPPATSVAPMDLGGQQVLILPVQASSGVGFNRDEITAEIVAALQTRDARTQWIAPDRLRRLLRQSPSYAPDPGALANDPYVHHGDRRIMGPLADAVRRYAALTEARLVVIPRGAATIADSAGSRVRLTAAVVDSRTGALVWWGEADGAPAAVDDRAGIVSAAEALARRMVVAYSR
jgi:hypothetical protein